MVTPIKIVIAVETSPTIIEMRVPQIVSVSTERPRSSVPSGYFKEGAWSCGPVEGQVGSRPQELARSGAKMATKTKNPRMIRSAIPIVFFRYSLHTRFAAALRRARAICFGVRGGSFTSMWTSGAVATGSVDVGRGRIVQAARTRGSRYEYRRSATRFATITEALNRRNRPWRTGKSRASTDVAVRSPRPGQLEISSIV